MKTLTVMRRSLGQFRTNPLRTALTLLGVVFGVGAVVAMMSIGEGAQRQILAQIEAMGATSIHVTSKPMGDKELSARINDSQGLTRADVRTIQQVLPGTKRVAYRARHVLGVSDLPVPVSEIEVLGISQDLFDVHNLSIAQGRKIGQLDHERGHRVAVIGADLARRAFPQGALGQSFRLDYSYFTVVGVLAAPQAANEEETSLSGEESSSSMDTELYQRGILIPFGTMTEELSPTSAYGELDMISVEVESTEDTLPGKRALTRLLEELHGGVRDFEIISPEEILRQRQSTQTIFNAVLISIAAISLLVGGIGVMNIMLANIMERISEIGLRRAIGARRRDIMMQFLLESVIICCVGGLIGIVLGLVLSFVVSKAIGLPIAFAWTSMVISFGISLIVGVTFGLMPAARAANVNPIEALRGD